LPTMQNTPISKIRVVYPLQSCPRAQLPEFWNQYSAQPEYSALREAACSLSRHPAPELAQAPWLESIAACNAGRRLYCSRLPVQSGMRPCAPSPQQTPADRQSFGINRSDPALRDQRVTHCSSIKRPPLNQAAFPSTCAQQEHSKVLIHLSGIRFSPKI
jgi:hypothetical protein